MILSFGMKCVGMLGRHTPSTLQDLKSVPLDGYKPSTAGILSKFHCRSQVSTLPLDTPGIQHAGNVAGYGACYYSATIDTSEMHFPTYFTSLGLSLRY